MDCAGVVVVASCEAKLMAELCQSRRAEEVEGRRRSDQGTSWRMQGGEGRIWSMRSTMVPRTWRVCDYGFSM